MLLEYKDYLKPIMEFSIFCKKQVNLQRIIKRENHTEPIRAIICFILIHKEENPQYRINTIFDTFDFQKKY